MNKNEYLEMEKEIAGRIKSLGEKRQELKQTYLDANLKLPIGSKVEINIPERRTLDGQKIIAPSSSEIGFIASKEVSYSGNPFYRLRKCKKDGSPSKHELSFWNIDVNDSNTKLIEQ